MDTVLKENMLNAIYNELSLEDKIEALKPTVLKTFEHNEVTFNIYKIYLTSVESNSTSASKVSVKLQALRYLKTTGIVDSIVESKAICDGAENGNNPMIGIANEKIANMIKRQLEEIGATVELRSSKVTEIISNVDQN